MSAYGSVDRALIAVVERLRAMPYGRPSDRSVTAMLREGVGTCSTKHAYLFEVLRDRYPDTEPMIVHRVYRIDRVAAEALFGAEIAPAVPVDCLIDVHRYLRCLVDGARITLDVTFPGSPPWDGRTSLPLACGPGTDHPAGSDPAADKRELEQHYCDPAVREPFIAALTAITGCQTH